MHLVGYRRLFLIEQNKIHTASKPLRTDVNRFAPQIIQSEMCRRELENFLALIGLMAVTEHIYMMRVTVILGHFRLAWLGFGWLGLAWHRFSEIIHYLRRSIQKIIVFITEHF